MTETKVVGNATAFYDGYDHGWNECRKEAWFTIVMTGLFSAVAGFLGGMAFVDLVF